MPILVTGGAGFVGSNICEILAGQGEEVVSLDLKPPDSPHAAGPRVRSMRGDIASYDSVLQAIRKHRVERIIAAAAKILGDQEDPLGTFGVNVLRDGARTLIDVYLVVMAYRAFPQGATTSTGPRIRWTNRSWENSGTCRIPLPRAAALQSG